MKIQTVTVRCHEIFDTCHAFLFFFLFFLQESDEGVKDDNPDNDDDDNSDNDDDDNSDNDDDDNPDNDDDDNF